MPLNNVAYKTAAEDETTPLTQESSDEETESMLSINSNKSSFHPFWVRLYNIFPSISHILQVSLINMALPFINGIMLGFGEIFAHELGFKFGYKDAKVLPAYRMEEDLALPCPEEKYGFEKKISKHGIEENQENHVLMLD